jgi:urease accessory protein
MAGFVPAIHVFFAFEGRKTWMPGTRPGMTNANKPMIRSCPEDEMKILGVLAAIVLAVSATPAFAHHAMGGVTPQTVMQGLLSGLGHPVIGLDHLATVIAIGLLASLHRWGAALVVGFVVAMMYGVAMHVLGVPMPNGVELMIALIVVVLGLWLVLRAIAPLAVAILLFVVAGFINGYALGESIFGAEATPFFAYLTGLAIVQSAIGIGAMLAARRFMQADVKTLRVAGVAIAGFGILLAARLVGFA